MNTLSLTPQNEKFSFLVSIKENVAFSINIDDILDVLDNSSKDSVLLAILKDAFENPDKPEITDKLKQQLPPRHWIELNNGLQWLVSRVKKEVSELSGLNESEKVYVSVLSHETLLISNDESILQFRRTVEY